MRWQGKTEKMSKTLAWGVGFHGCHTHLSPQVSNRKYRQSWQAVQRVCLEGMRCGWTVATAHSPSASQDIVFSVREVAPFLTIHLVPRPNKKPNKRELCSSHYSITQHHLPYVQISQEKKILSELKICKSLFFLFALMGLTQGYRGDTFWLNCTYL